MKGSTLFEKQSTILIKTVDPFVDRLSFRNLKERMCLFWYTLIFFMWVFSRCVDTPHISCWCSARVVRTLSTDGAEG